MAVVGTADIKYRAIGLKQMERDIKKAEKAFIGAATAIGATALSVGTAVLKVGMPFEQMVLDASAAMRATEGQMKALEAAARQAGATTEHTATQAGAALKFMGKAGLDAAQAIKGLPAMMNFKTAIGSLLDLGTATDIITDSMTSMGLEVKDLTHLTDLFIGVSNRSSTDVRLVGESFKAVAGVARLYGSNVEELTAILGVQAQAGIKGSIAGRQLKNAYTRTSLAAAELGIKNEGLVKTLEAVSKANWDADKIASIYGKIALPTVAAMLGKISGSGKGTLSWFKQELAGVSYGMGESAKQAEVMRRSVENQFKIVQSQISDLALTLFDQYKPAMLEALKITQQFLKENKGDILGLVEDFKKLAEVVMVGGALLVGLRAITLAGTAMNAMWAGTTTAITLAKIALTSQTAAIGPNVTAWTVLNTTLVGTNTGFMAAATSGKIFQASLIGLKVAAGAVFAAFAGWKIGSILYDEFEGARIIGLSFVDFMMRGVIEIEHAFKIAWAAIKTTFGVTVGEMLKTFNAFVSLAQEVSGALGMDEMSAGFTSMSEGINGAISDMTNLAGSIDKARAARESDIETHEKMVAAIADEHKEAFAVVERLRLQEEMYQKIGVMGEDLYNKKKAAIEAEAKDMLKVSNDAVKVAEWRNKALFDLDEARVAKSNATAKSASDAIKSEFDSITTANSAAAEEQLKIQEEMYAKFGIMGQELYEQKLAEIDVSITRLRLTKADEVLIEQKKNDAIAKLNAARAGKSLKDIKKATKDIDKENKKRVKDYDKTIKEMDKLDAQMGKDFKKSLDNSKKVFEQTWKEILGVKQISKEAQEQIDKDYANFYAQAQDGDVVSYTEAQGLILSGKKENIEKAIELDENYSKLFSDRQAEMAEAVRMEFYEKTGTFSDEYYQKQTEAIETQKQKWIDAGLSVVTAQEEADKRLAALDISRLESTNTFFSGVQAALLQSQTDFGNWQQAGQDAYNALETSIKGGFENLATNALKGNFSEIETDFADMGNAMVSKTVDIVGQIVAEWAAAKITEAAVWAGTALFNSFSTAHEGQFNIQGGPGQGQGGLSAGEIPIIAKVGESILTPEQTAAVANFFGIDTTSPQADWDGINAEIEAATEPGMTTSDILGYGESAASIIAAYNAFAAGDNLAGSMAMADALGKGLQAYGAQNSSQAATQAGTSITSAVGAVGAGYGAFAAYEQGDYITAGLSAYQAVEAAIAAYEAAAAAVSAASSGAGATTVVVTTEASSGITAGAGTTSGAVSGAGAGLAGYSLADSALDGMLSSGKYGSEYGREAAAVVGGVVGYLAGPVAGAVAGTAAGGIVSAIGPGWDQFTLDELDATVSAERAWNPETGIGLIQTIPGGNATTNAQGAVLQQLNADAAAINSIYQNLRAEMPEADRVAFEASMSTFDASVDTAGGRWWTNTAGSAVQDVSGYYWNNALEHLGASIPGGVDMSQYMRATSIVQASDMITEQAAFAQAYNKAVAEAWAGDTTVEGGTANINWAELSGREANVAQSLEEIQRIYAAGQGAIAEAFSISSGISNRYVLGTEEIAKLQAQYDELFGEYVQYEMNEAAGGTGTGGVGGDAGGQGADGGGGSGAGFAEGGIIDRGFAPYGGIPGMDNVMIPAQTGEFVLSREGTAHAAELLEDLNSGDFTLGQIQGRGEVISELLLSDILTRVSQLIEVNERIISAIDAKQLRVTGEEIALITAGPLQSLVNEGRYNLGRVDYDRIETINRRFTWGING